MSSKKAEAFFDKVESAGLSRAFGRMNDIASDELGVYLEDIIEDAVYEMEKPVCRVRYEDKDGERYIFETRRADEDEYQFACSYEMVDDRIYYQALTQVREYMKLGYEICFK